MKKLANIHPEKILIEEFLKLMGITVYWFSRETEILQTRISHIIKGKRRITADTALHLSSIFGNPTKFWLGLQNDFVLEEQRNNNKEISIRIQKSRKDSPLQSL